MKTPPPYDLTVFCNGLSVDNGKILMSLFDKINYDQTSNAITIQYIAPVISRIFRTIVKFEGTEHNYDYQFNFFSQNPERIPEAIDMIDVERIIVELDDYYDKFLPVVHTHLPYIDQEAEMTLHYCRNYTIKICKDINNKNLK